MGRVREIEIYDLCVCMIHRNIHREKWFCSHDERRDHYGRCERGAGTHRRKGWSELVVLVGNGLRLAEIELQWSFPRHDKCG